MDELIEIISELLTEIRELNSKIDDIKGFGLYGSINDVCDKLDDIKSEVEAIWNCQDLCSRNLPKISFSCHGFNRCNIFTFIFGILSRVPEGTRITLDRILKMNIICRSD